MAFIQRTIDMQLLLEIARQDDVLFEDGLFFVGSDYAFTAREYSEYLDELERAKEDPPHDEDYPPCDF